MQNNFNICQEMEISTTYPQLYVLVPFCPILQFHLLDIS